MKKRIHVPWPEEWKKQIHLSTQRTNLIYTPKDFIISFSLYIITVIACMLLRSLDETGDTSYVAMLFLTDVFLTAVLTDGYLFSILCAVLGVFSVDYIFTEPYWHISFTLAGFPLTFLVMMTISILAGALASRAKQVEVTQRQMQREKMRGNLLRGMSHDIRTPLTGIVGATDVLLEQDGSLTPQQRRELLQSINEEARWLMRVSENLLSITRIDGENAGVKKTPELVEEIIEGAVSKFLRHYKGITVQVHLPEEPMLVPMDPLLMQQVLFNLMENAARHGETVNQIDISLSQKDEWAILDVADNGVGIAEETLKTLFKPFEQGGTHIARAYGGTGLGLSISKSIIKHMGGDIAVTSTPGKGSAFSFLLWLKEADNTPQQREAPDKSPAALAGKRILLVDDVEINRIIVIEQLSNLGLRMDEAADGTEAVAMFARSPVNFYDLIFMDLQMPRMDGYAAAKAIRAMDRPDARSVPIIALTANAFKEDVDLVLANGMNGHLAKPLENDKLMEMLEKLLANGDGEQRRPPA